MKREAFESEAQPLGPTKKLTPGGVSFTTRKLTAARARMTDGWCRDATQ